MTQQGWKEREREYEIIKRREKRDNVTEGERLGRNDNVTGWKYTSREERKKER